MILYKDAKANKLDMVRVTYKDKEFSFMDSPAIVVAHVAYYWLGVGRGDSGRRAMYFGNVSEPIVIDNLQRASTAPLCLAHELRVKDNDVLRVGQKQ